MRVVLICLLALACPLVAFAKEKASFIKGTYATQEGCKMLGKLAAGTPRALTTVPDTLDEDGFHSWEGSCEFTKVFEHQPGAIWTGLMYCVEGNTINVPTLVFLLNEEDQSFEVVPAGSDAPEVWHRCNVK